MNKLPLITIILLAALLTSCTLNNKRLNQTQTAKSFLFKIKNLSDKDYPDNPDIGFRSKNYRTDFFKEGRIDIAAQPFLWNFTFLTKGLDTILLNNIDISELIPTIPEYIKPNEYLSYIACINQEWNRNQVRFSKDEFLTTIPKNVRVDLARNCLNAYLWEVILYIEEDGKVVPLSHGWFDFPHELYAQLFEKKNNIPFVRYKAPLENWIDPESKKIDLDLLRTVVDTVENEFRDLSDEMYPLKAARKKKYKGIICPDPFSTMRDLQSDSTMFATFSPPGIYNKQDPRKTELGRIHHLLKANLYKVESRSTNEPLYEIQLTFSHKYNETTLIIGGIDLDEFPVLKESEVNQGWKNSMGIGNNSFYESYKDHLINQSKKSPYYAMFLSGNGKWLDSHHIGIDGPMFHFSDEKRETLHVWLLSFERHALVGHYKIKISNSQFGKDRHAYHIKGVGAGC